MKTVCALLIAHFIGDYLLQQHPIFLYKQYSLRILVMHTVIYASAVSVALGMLHKFKGWKWLFLFIGHTIIDYYKLYFFPHPTTPLYINIIDQMLHIVQLYIVSDLYKDRD